MPFYCLKNFFKMTEKNKGRKDKRIVDTVIAPKGNKRVSLPASATVEASLVIPLYVYMVLAVAYVLEMISVKSTMQQAMYSSIRELARYAYTAQDSGLIQSDGVKSAVSVGMAKAFLLKNLPEKFAAESRIKGGTAGIRVSGSRLLANGNELCLKVTYTIENPFDIFGIGRISICQQCASAAWLGEDYTEYTKEQQREDTIVYITIHGTVYHRDKQCRYLNPTIQKVTTSALQNLRNVSGGKYYACERCVKNREGVEVYITDYGDRYHNDVNCSGLKRSVFSVPLSKVGDKRPCSKCG